MTVVMESIEDAARKLADYNVEAAPETEAIYFFPHPDEIRLIETDPTTLSDTEIVPYYFGASPKSGIPFRSAVALIRPEEAFRLPLPPGWGTWNDAVKLWPQE
jgi:hypothetical protein